jgi:hypothetical protein
MLVMKQNMEPVKTVLPPLPKGQALTGVRVWNNNAGGLTETAVEFMAVCENDSLDFKRQILANLVATYGKLKIEIKPGELEAIRNYYSV